MCLDFLNKIYNKIINHATIMDCFVENRAHVPQDCSCSEPSLGGGEAFSISAWNPGCCSNHNIFLQLPDPFDKGPRCGELSAHDPFRFASLMGFNISGAVSLERTCLSITGGRALVPTRFSPL